jgi:ubiquinone/menaquinone biosynthesis C-methylase UbiE
MDVVDLCSYDGWFTLRSAKLARHVIAIDIDPRMLEMSRHHLIEADASNCELPRAL